MSKWEKIEARCSKALLGGGGAARPVRVWSRSCHPAAISVIAAVPATCRGTPRPTTTC